MSGVKEIYYSIKFLEKWQGLISNITNYSVDKLNEFATKYNFSNHFSIGELYPTSGIKYGNYINFHKNDKTFTDFLYFGFNFNLYEAKNIAHYPKQDIIGSKLNHMSNEKHYYPRELEHFMKAKQEELVDEFIFGLSLHKKGLTEEAINELNKVSIRDIDDFFYIPIETHLLYLEENVEQISLQIINICKKYLFMNN